MTSLLTTLGLLMCMCEGLSFWPGDKATFTMLTIVSPSNMSLFYQHYSIGTMLQLYCLTTHNTTDT